MERPERPALAELAEWLKYYRDLGFTHLYRRPSPLSATEVPKVPLASGEAHESQTLPSPSATMGQTSPDTFPNSEFAVKTAPGSLFSGIAPGETLEQIRDDLGDCRRCKLWKGRKSIVFGSGNPKAEIVFVGEGPGADEDEQGLPFVGRAGQLLTDMIEKGMKIPRSEVYICNIIKCRPPENRKPEKDEVAACRRFVERQIDAVRPRVICALGATAAETLLDRREAMGKLRGQWYEFHGFPLLVSYHPAFLLRDPSKKSEAWTDLKKIMAFLNSDPRR
ncbi:MAG: uracil-DNA glycosylase [Acidobacteria bacterium]|nr:uracil-DNA glycosylase [Acidobacteriota bacterium]